MGARTKILGVVNMTEDSFSDGGMYLSAEKAIERSRQLVEDGADVIDLGPASTHPEAKPVTPEEEIRRIEPVIDRLIASGIEVSVDSFQPDTQKYCARRGVHYLNDIQGFPEPEAYPEIARSSCSLIVMHSIQRRGRAIRVATDPRTLLDDIHRFFEDRLRALASAGIDRNRMILDPGMGFFLGSNPEPSLVVLRNIQRLKAAFGLPVLICVSRKSFLGTITGRDVGERGPASLGAEVYAAMQGADYIRTHEARPLRDALAVLSALNGNDGDSATL